MENKTIGCAGFHHAALHSSDFEKSYKFYTEGLGFKEYRRWKTDAGKTIVLLDAGCGALVELFSDGEKRTCFEEQSGFYVHLALKVKDSRSAYNRAIEYGAESKMPPKDMVLPAEPPINATISFVKGPDGEEIEFFQVND